VHHGWHGTHRYDIQVLATHTSTWVQQYSSLLQLSVPLGQRGHVTVVLCVLCTKCTFHSNYSATRVIFQTHTTYPPERPFSHYIKSHRLAAGMWTTTKNNFLGEKKCLSCSFYLYRFRKYLSYGFPIINFRNPGVHYETPCIVGLTRKHDMAMLTTKNWCLVSRTPVHSSIL